MSTQKKPAVLAAVIIGALLVFSATILPTVVKDRVCEAIRQATGRVVSIDALSINPFTLAVTAKELVIREKGGDPFITCPALRAAISPASIYKRSLILEEVTLESPSLSITRTAPDRYSFSDIMERCQAQKKPVKQGSLIFTINNVTVTNGSVQFRDEVPKGGFKGSLNDIDVKLKNFSTAADSAAEYELSLLVDDEAQLSSEGSFSLSPLAVRASTDLEELNLQKGWPYLARFLTAPLKGILDLSGDVSFSKAAGLNAENGRMTIHNMSTRYGSNEGVDAASLSVTGASFRQKENLLEVAEIKLAQGNISVTREADGKLSPLSLLAATRKPPTKKPLLPGGVQQNGTAKAAPPAKALSYRLKRVQVDRLNLLFSDKTRPEKQTFSLKDTSVVLANLNGPHFTPAQLRFSAIFGTRASLKGNGDITPLPLSYKGEINIQHLPVKDFGGYFPEELKVRVVDGYLDAALKVDITLKEGKPGGTFKGSTGLRSFHSIDIRAKEDLLKWESLQLDEFQGSLEPLILDVRKIALNGVYSRIIVRKDGTLNLQNLVQKSAAEAGTPQPVTQQSARAESQITIGAVTIQDGTLSFSDNHLPKQFATTLHKLGGRISGLSSEASSFADVDLRGNLEGQSPLQITGRINPLRDDLYVDLKASLHDIELSPASPYSGNYLGYTIEKGKLFLDLKYHIEKKVLTSENKIFIDQFTFGSKVESDKATSLPVQLGVALLKDRNGGIHLDIPVTGRIDNPELNIWKLVGQAFTNMLVKAVTSPLALLSSLFGSDEDFSAIPFAPGTSVILTSEELKLDHLAKALFDRPALKIELKGYVDREKDMEAYRSELLNRKIKHEKVAALRAKETLKADDNVETIQVLPEEYATYLTAVYRREKFPKPRNVLGLVKSLPPDEMKKLIIVNTVIGEHELHALAHERVVAIMGYLVRKGNIPAERLFQNDDDVFKAPEKESLSRSRVEMTAIAQ